MQMTKLEDFEPDGHAACLCGSGEKFKNCCKDEYKKRDHRGRIEKYSNAKQRLNLLRAHICWYRLCHKAHTLILLKVDPEEGARLLRVDIKALAEMLQQLERLYFENEITTKFNAALEEISHAIDHADWVVEVDIIKALHYMLRFEDREKARYFLSRYDPRVATNSELIEAYLDVFSGKLNHVDIIVLAERVVLLTNSDSSRLQYRFLASMQYFLLNDIVEGEKRALFAINEYESLPDSKRTIYGRVRLAGAYKSLGEAISSDEYIRKAVEVLVGIVGGCELNGEGLAGVWSDIAECQRNLKEYESAEINYRRSLRLFKNSLVEVLLVRLLLDLNRQEDARELISNIDISGFSESNLFDYSIAWCELAIASLRQCEIDRALVLIKSVKTNDPLFMQLNKDLIVQLYELQVSRSGEGARSVLGRMNKYFTINPSVLGVGINVNAIIDDFINKRKG